MNIALPKEAEVFFVGIDGQHLRESAEVKLACDLLGVKFKTHIISMTNDKESLESIKKLNNSEVLILAENVLKYFNKGIASLPEQHDRKTKILILGINSDIDIQDLKIWSGNKIKNFRQYELPSDFMSIRVEKNDLISKELGALEYPFNGSGAGILNGFELEDSVGVVRLAEVVDKSGKPVCPIFFKTDSAKGSVFFLTSWEKVISTEANTLLKIMPILMFLKYSFGDRCWHGINDYANLTIDDPWLREPYGYIRFADLCREAIKTRFHVTIGFIPYNYQKSHNDAVEIFRKCQENLSIAVHGNNHDLSEFRFSGNESITDNRLSEICPNEKNTLQALYRMDTFSHNTGLSYDRAMIFPRGTFTKESLGVLKKNNFLMTVNSTKPFNAGHLTNTLDRMRRITLEFGNFPMLIRSGIPDWKNDKRAVEEAKSLIKMRLFLDLPILLYTHHGFFKDGADEFNSIAKMINKVQPDVVWAGLGNIAKGLYLQKRVQEREIEILSFTSDINIVNKHDVPVKYVIRKTEDFLVPIESVEVDGVKHEYLRDGDHIRIEVFIEPGYEKNIRILYHSDTKAGSVIYSDSDLRVTLIRTLSGFRDIYLSKLPFGDKVVKVFYWAGGVKNIAIGISVLTGIALILFIWYFKSTISKKNILRNKPR